MFACAKVSQYPKILASAYHTEILHSVSVPSSYLVRNAMVTDHDKQERVTNVLMPQLCLWKDFFSAFLETKKSKIVLKPVIYFCCKTSNNQLPLEDNS